MLLCDFHIHTTFSGGSPELDKTIDLSGQAGFDVIAVTDHVVNGDNVMPMTVPPGSRPRFIRRRENADSFFKAAVNDTVIEEVEQGNYLTQA